MRVVITGGAGFLGKLLAQKILAVGQLRDGRGDIREVSEVVLVDMAAAHGEPWLADGRISIDAMLSSSSDEMRTR